LTDQERERLLSLALLDSDYEDRIRNRDTPKVPFTLDELDDLLGHVSAEANHCEDEQQQAALDQIAAKIEETLDRYDDGNFPNRESDTLNAAVGQLESLAKAMHVDLETVIDYLNPKRVEPDDEIALSLTPTDKQLLLDIDGLGDEVRNVIRKGKRKFEFAYRQIETLERLVAQEMDGVDDKQAIRKWEQLHGKLKNLLTKYTTGDDTGALDRLLAGKGDSTSAVRELLSRLAERHG